MTQVWSAGIKRLYSGGQISWTSAIERVHNAAQFELDSLLLCSGTESQ